MIYSMTGYASRAFQVQGTPFRIELKSLNHRFLEMKFRIPREWSALETGLRALIEKRIKRGSVEVFIERQIPAGASGDLQLNVAQARQVFELLSKIKSEFKLSEPISIRDISSYPDVIAKGGVTAISETDWPLFQKTVEKELQGALEDLVKMRAQEGDKLKQALLAIVAQFKKAHGRLLEQREAIRNKSQEKIKKRIEQCFEAYPTPDAQVRALLETRISQEIAIALDRLDVEEELTRYTGHIQQIEKVLNGDEPAGKKLDFMLQELNREVNTLGNKSQDLEMSQEVIQLKMWVEQLREQCMNLE